MRERAGLEQYAALLEKAASDESLARGLDILGSGDRSYFQLYKLYEAIREDLAHANPSKSISGMGWASRNELARLTQTAQSYEVLGDESRHATTFHKAPNNRTSR